MKIYWGTKNIPELAGLTWQQRGEIYWACWPHAFRHWQTWIALLILVVSFIVGWIIMERLLAGSWLVYCIFLIMYSIGVVVLYSVEAEQLRPYFREYLRRRKG